MFIIDHGTYAFVVILRFPNKTDLIGCFFMLTKYFANNKHFANNTLTIFFSFFNFQFIVIKGKGN